MKNLIELKKYYLDNKLGHAYLIETDDVLFCKNSLLNVIKNIFCVDEYSENCNKCSLCHLIDFNNLPSLKIIEPDGIFIKKEQILDLISDFSKTPVYTKENIYIILYADKMNKEASNSILKFLEEPSPNIIGFFITSNVEKILSTIKSRTQHILNNYNLRKESKFSGLTEKIILEIEKEKSHSIFLTEQILELEKEEIILLFNELLDTYISILHGNSLKYNLSSISNIELKINKIIGFLEKINYNINMSMLLDSFILEMEDL